MLLLVSGEWMEWFNYPGLEIWKFLNLAIFLAIAIIVLRRKLNEALLARGEAIKQELITAQKEREKSLARLAEAETQLSRLDEDVNLVREQARREAEAERERLAVSTEREIEKLRQQAQRDMRTADKVARKELRQYLAMRSVEVAREAVKSQMRPEDDTLLIRESIGELRRTTV
jgi:F0F1-type ATP synthase membrane subunit b/b'